MSHFSVLVIGDNVEEQLGPYQENNMDDCPKQYLKFNDIEEEYRERYNNEIMDGEYMKKNHPDKFGKKPCQVFGSFEEYMEEWCGESDIDHETGKYGYWENPNSKWDWYSKGGRWSGMLKLKPGARGEVGEPGLAHLTGQSTMPELGFVDQAKKADIDWEGMFEASRKKSEEDWEKSEQEEDEFKKYYSLGRDKEDTKESYIERYSRFSTFAVVKNGEWYEKGSMGWWGAVSDEKDPKKWTEEFESLIKGLDGDTLLTVIDCHI